MAKLKNKGNSKGKKQGKQQRQKTREMANTNGRDTNKAMKF